MWLLIPSQVPADTDTVVRKLIVGNVDHAIHVADMVCISADSRFMPTEYTVWRGSRVPIQRITSEHLAEVAFKHK